MQVKVSLGISRSAYAPARWVTSSRATGDGVALPVSQTGFARDNGRTLGNVNSIGDQAASGVLAIETATNVDRRQFLLDRVRAVQLQADMAVPFSLNFFCPLPKAVRSIE